MKEYTPQARAAWFMLRLSEAGFRASEIIAQFAASYIISGDADGHNAEALFELDSETSLRTFQLMLDPSEIWPGLLPGGALDQEGWPDWEMVENDELIKLRSAMTVVDKILAAATEDISAEDFSNIVTVALKNEGFITDNPEKLPYEQNGIAEFDYSVSIIINPTVRHDETTDLISPSETLHDTSPLNLAATIWDKIDYLDKIGKWPAEELCAWITHIASGSDWIMTFDQANGLKALAEAAKALESHDWDDTFQEVQDNMSFAGYEYTTMRSIQR